MDFIGLYLFICASFLLQDLFTPDGFYLFRWINQCPYIVDLHGLYLRSHGSKPCLRVRSLKCIHIGDQTLIVLIELNEIAISDQETVVSIQLMRYTIGSPRSEFWV